MFYFHAHVTNQTLFEVDLYNFLIKTLHLYGIAIYLKSRNPDLE